MGLCSQLDQVQSKDNTHTHIHTHSTAQHRIASYINIDCGVCVCVCVCVSQMVCGTVGSSKCFLPILQDILTKAEVSMKCVRVHSMRCVACVCVCMCMCVCVCVCVALSQLYLTNARTHTHTHTHTHTRTHCTHTQYRAFIKRSQTLEQSIMMMLLWC